MEKHIQTSRYIEHAGVVRHTQNDHVTVSIVSQSACAACHAKGQCSVLDQKEKTVDVTIPNHNYQVGEEVNVLMIRSQGFKALFLGYILPFLVLMVTLLLVTEITGKEGLAGLMALGILLPYYLVLFLTRDNIKKSFSFVIQKR